MKPYEIAADKLNDLFASLKLSVAISEPFAEVKDGRKWPCIGFRLTIGRETFEYFLGIGHVDWKQAAQILLANRWKTNYTSNEENAVRILARGGNVVPEANEHVARAAAKIAKAQKVQPKPAEVLAYICRDGYSAEQSSFEDWASELGYDIDSIKARATYDACLEEGRKARRIISGAHFERFAQLANEL